MWNVVHTECLSLINSMTTRLSNKKLTNGIAGSGAVVAGSGSSIGGGGDGGVGGGLPPATSLLSEQTTQHQSECASFK